MQICSVCGTAIHDPYATECPNCGAPISPEASAPRRFSLFHGSPKRTKESPAPEVSTPTSFSPPSLKDAARSDPSIPVSRKNKLVLVGLLFLTLAAVALAFFFLRPKASAHDSSPAKLPDAVSGFSSQGGLAVSQSAGTSALSNSASQSTSLPETLNRPSAVGSSEQIVFRNSMSSATITVDGIPVPFDYVGTDAVLDRSLLPSVCQVRVIVPLSTGYQTAAVWFNEQYAANQYDYVYSFGDENDYGRYQHCDPDGLCPPDDKMVDVLTWAYFRGFLQCINGQTMDYLVYSTASNTSEQTESVFSSANTHNTYDLNDFSAVAVPESIRYDNGTVLYNATFRSISSDRNSSRTVEITDHRTIELVYEDGFWKVNRIAFLNDDDFNAGQYAFEP